MVHKLKYLGANKNKVGLRVYLSDVISKIEDFIYIDNPNIQNKFHKGDHKVSANLISTIYKQFKMIRKMKTKS